MVDHQHTDAATRLAHDVEVIAAAPRHRAIAGSTERARGYIERQLHEAGWSSRRIPHQSGPALLRTSDYGRRLWPFGAGGPIAGESVLATAPGASPDGTVWLIAHLDSVHCSPGADDNASGVALVLEMARRIGPAHGLTLLLTDNEEAGVLGARLLVRQLEVRPRLVINLESLGFRDPRPGVQRLLPEITLNPRHRPLVKQLRDNEMRGDFVMTLHRPDSAAAAHMWQTCATDAGLLAVAVEDRRHSGRGQGVTARLNPAGMNYDRAGAIVKSCGWVCHDAS